ncbi:MAG: phage tail protein [Candidatus Omnitrophica bacterium]|jgi:catechol 2,3-dioxygenase-like lactoylglutathione lyase family enzyme|nr:phage tail protein [Candidatus Omnitrophota bacterium]
MDCLGVVLEALRRLRPDLDLIDPWPDQRSVLEDSATFAPGWTEVPLARGPRTGDVLILRGAGEHHLGLQVGPNVLHAVRGAGVVLTPLARLERRVLQVLRPPERIEGPWVRVLLIERAFPPPIRKRILRLPWRGASCLELAAGLIRAEAGPITATLEDGRQIRGELLAVTVPPPGATVILAALPAGIETILFSVLLPMVVGALMGFASQALMGPQKPVASARGLGEESPTYTWAGIETTYGVGHRIPMIWGHHRVGGQCIGRTIWERFERPGASATAPESFADHLRLLLAIGEGPIYAIGDLPDGSPDQIFGEPVAKGAIPGGLRVNGSEAFSAGDAAEARSGEIHQAPFADWLAFSSVLAVAGDLPYGVPYRYVTVGVNVSRMKVRISFAGGLYRLTSGGLPSYYQVDFRFRFRRYDPVNPGPWFDSDPFLQVFEGRAHRGPFIFSFDVEPAFFFEPPGQWEIEVYRLTPDDEDPAFPSTARASSVCTWSEVIEESQVGENTAPSYPGTALLSLDIQATERISGPSPNVTFPVWGRLCPYWIPILGWQEPAFYLASPAPKWIGRNPAWVLADFLTSRRGGLGNHFTLANIDAEKFAEWADWCDELVDDGEGGLEARCRCDFVLDSGAPAWETIRTICRTGDAVPILVGSILTVRWDHPVDRTQVFTRANSRDLQITFQDNRVRPNIIDVQILSEAADFETEIVSIEDPLAIGVFEPWKLGAEPVRAETIQVLGVTRVSQARRIGIFRHLQERIQDHHITLTVGLEALAAELGDRVGLETDVVQFFEWGTESMRAREAGATQTQIVLDRDVTLAAAATYRIVVETAAGWVERVVSSPAGDYPAGTPIAFAAPALSWSIGAVVGIGRDEALLRDYQIARIRLLEDLSAELTLVPYSDDVFDLEEVEEFGPTDEDPLPDPVPPPAPMLEVALDPEGGGEHRVSWVPPPELAGREVMVYARPEGGRWALIYRGTGSSAALPWAMPPGGALELQVLSAGAGSVPTGSAAATSSTAQEWAPRSPGVPSGLEAFVSPGRLTLSWDPVEGAVGYELRVGTYWSGARLLDRVLGPGWSGFLPSSEFPIHVRALDSQGMFSERSATITVDVLPPLGFVVESEIEVLEG